MTSNRTDLYAFTLLEIMIVVAIIGMLAAIAIPNLTKSTKDAQRQACKANLRTIQGAKVQWALTGKRADSDTPGDDDLFGPQGYIDPKPECPAGGAYELKAVDSKAACTIAAHNR